MVNEAMWQQYYKQEISKEEVRLLRFYNTIGQDKAMCLEISQDYIANSVMQTAVFPHTHEVLHLLKERKYRLHIISNGFREVQEKKLRNTKLSSFFETVTTSEDSGFHKPTLEAFQFALEKAGANAEESAIIGDDLTTDIKGGIQAGLYTIYFNPNSYNATHKADKEILSLKSLAQIFD